MRVTVGVLAAAPLTRLKAEKAETRLLEGGAMEPSSCTVLIAASCLRTIGSGSAFRDLPFFSAAALALDAFLGALAELLALAGFSLALFFFFSMLKGGGWSI